MPAPFLDNLCRTNKACTTCGVNKPASAFYFHKVSGLDAHCIPCKTKAKRDKYAAAQAALGLVVRPQFKAA